MCSVARRPPRPLADARPPRASRAGSPLAARAATSLIATMHVQRRASAAAATRGRSTPTRFARGFPSRCSGRDLLDRKNACAASRVGRRGHSRTLDPHALRARVPLSLLGPLIFLVPAVFGVLGRELLLEIR